jgi:protein O-GlcNAc transferase
MSPEIRNLSLDVRERLTRALQDRRSGNLQAAEQIYREVIEIEPTYDTFVSLGDVLMDQGKTFEAMRCYGQAIKIEPNQAYAHHRLGETLIRTRDQKLASLAIACYRKALELDPHNAEHYNRLGVIHSSQGEPQEAADCFKQALALKPDFVRARLNLYVNHLRILYDQESEISETRKCYQEELEHLCQTTRLSTSAEIEEVAEAVGDCFPFYLPYQGLNDRELQSLYGKWACRLHAAGYPQWAQTPAMPHSSPGEPFRIGIVSGFFWNHTNWNFPIKGWVENLDKRRFQLYGYHTGTKKDHNTERARQAFVRLVKNVFSFKKLARMISEDRLHLLIFPEVGMNALTFRLASLKLAPIQCTSMGHPITSGLPTMDYYLSSELMEPAGAEADYTEKLVKLPNLSVFYSPQEFPENGLSRASFDLKSGGILFFCAQALFKYLPQYDTVFPQIVQKVGNCQFAFIQGHSIHLTNQFRRRLQRAFANYGLNYEDYVVILPRLNETEYHALNCLSDIFLDSIGWSGCNTTLEALACDLPVVTLPGNMMRSRHSMAFLTMMGLTETIASNLEEYMAVAVRLALNANWRQQIRQKIAATKDRLYRDMTCIKALEEFLESAIRSYA